MGRKKRKRIRKLKHRQKKIFKSTDKLAKYLAVLISRVPRRKYEGHSFTTKTGDKGCIPFTSLFGYVYCRDCYAKEFCQIRKEPKLILKNGKLEELCRLKEKK